MEPNRKEILEQIASGKMSVEGEITQPDEDEDEDFEDEDEDEEDFCDEDEMEYRPKASTAGVSEGEKLLLFMLGIIIVGILFVTSCPSSAPYYPDGEYNGWEQWPI